ncbi:MAG: ATP/GTP-binding protein [Thermoplasmata archaeon]|nr:ATP/GTP-binding protein [Thermoplasmata archaeon]
MQEERVFLYIVGTAGSGKSTLTHAFREWLAYKGLDAITVNLDPGAENLKYSPDVDIRDWVSLKEVMEEYDLGPNGAQIVCADMIALNIEEIKETINSFKTNYVVIDTPGQIELFVFREAGRIITLSLDPNRSLVAFLLDPILTKTASDFVSQLLLSITTRFRLNLPLINILSKCDLIKEDKLLEIKNWSSMDDNLYETLLRERASISRELSEQIMHLLRHFDEGSSLIAVSSEDFTGMEDLYNALQMCFRGGEDTLSD